MYASFFKRERQYGAFKAKENIDRMSSFKISSYGPTSRKKHEYTSFRQNDALNISNTCFIERK